MTKHKRSTSIRHHHQPQAGSRVLATAILLPIMVRLHLFLETQMPAPRATLFQSSIHAHRISHDLYQTRIRRHTDYHHLLKLCSMRGRPPFLYPQTICLGHHFHRRFTLCDQETFHQHMKIYDKRDGITIIPSVELVFRIFPASGRSSYDVSLRGIFG